MRFNIGEKVKFSRLAIEEYQIAKIIERKDEPSGRYIHKENASGNFDYLIEIIIDGQTEHLFCQESELKSINE